MPPTSIFPPPLGSDSKIFPAAISSSKRFSITSDRSPRGVSVAFASTTLAPTTDGTTMREPGPTNTYQPPIPRATASIAAIMRLRRTRLLMRRLVPAVISRIGFSTVISFTGSGLDFFFARDGFSLIF